MVTGDNLPPGDNTPGDNPPTENTPGGNNTPDLVYQLVLGSRIWVSVSFQIILAPWVG